MRRQLDFILERLLSLTSKNKLLVKTARRVLLSHYIRKGFERIFHFYAVARFEEGFDSFVGGFYSHPWFAAPSGRTMNIEITKRNLITIKRILDSAGIRFWLMYGTFLGAYRDKAIIPYDEDSDLGIYAEDLPALVNCEDEFIKEGFYLAVVSEGATLFYGGEHTDFYLFRLKDSKRVWLDIKYDISAFETFNEIEFLGQNWRILSEPERWLKYTYGEDWKTPIKGKGVKGCAYGEKFEST